MSGIWPGGGRNADGRPGSRTLATVVCRVGRGTGVAMGVGMAKASESMCDMAVVDAGGVLGDRMALFTATMQLFEHFLDNPPPAKRYGRVWNRLEMIAWEMHGHAAESSSGSPAHRLCCLRTVLNEARSCFEELRRIEPAPVTLRAMKRLEAVVIRVEDALDRLPEVVMS